MFKHSNAAEKYKTNHIRLNRMDGIKTRMKRVGDEKCLAANVVFWVWREKIARTSGDSTMCRCLFSSAYAWVVHQVIGASPTR